jgi:hypothetical protein
MPAHHLKGTSFMTTINQTSENQAPAIAKLDDINREFAARSFYNTSYSPEQRGESRRQEYADSVNGLYAELWPLANTDGQKNLLAAEMERYRQGYLSRMNAWLASHANVASSMITGPARFPVARMQKRSRWADNKANELFEWDKKASAAIKRKLLDARPEEEKDAAEWRQLAKEISRSLNVIEGVDERGDYWTRSAFVNSIAGKVERLALAGNSGLVDKALELVKAYGDTHKKPAITGRHTFWTFGELAHQKAAKAATLATSEPEALAEGGGVKIICNAAIDRVQIIFPEKPEAEMIGKLKKEAWNWSRSNEAWQRKLTEAAKQSAKEITGLSHALDASEEA